jgi:geranial dehydrogenase
MSNDRNSFFIGGEWVAPASDKRFTLIGAGTGERIGSAPEAVEADVDKAVAAARQAFDHSTWPTCAPAERAAAMRRFAQALQKRAPDLARAVSEQNGMPITLSELLEGGFSVGVLSYYAELAAGLDVAEKRPSQMGVETLVERCALGVVAAIVPWNFPVTLAMSKIAPAMAAGCTLVIKPSPGTILDSYILAEAAEEAGLPPGVVNWVAADRAVGAYLVSHPGVDKVAFTGSTTAGRIIARTCGELLRPVTLELGGKSAAIILDDADLDVVMQGLPMASLLNNGQACYNGTRILAPAGRYKEVVDALAAMVAGFKVGDPLDRSTTLGPMATAAHRDRVEGYIAKGKSEARLVAGGGRPKGLDRGWFVEPTVFADVDNSAIIAQEEIFGPVLSVISYKDDADAVRIANQSMFGLGGSVWSTDGERARKLARRVESGTVGINGYMPSLGSPFGGIKASGLGREFGPEAVGGYQQQKSIYVMG